MNLTPYYLDSLYRCTKQDWDEFKALTAFLPRRTDEPYHSGPHNLARFAMVCALVRPKWVLEIGFNLGHSSVAWLAHGVEKVVSIEPFLTDKRAKAAEEISKRYPGRFTIHWTDSRYFIPVMHPDLIFIDGSHEREWVKRDIELGLEMQTPYFLMDDYDSHHGPGVVQAVEDCGLIPVAIFGTMALCRPSEGFTHRSDPLGSNYYD